MKKISLYIIVVVLFTNCVTQKDARVLDQYLNSEIEKKAQMLECDSIKRAILKENSDFKYQLEKLMDKSAELVTQKDSLKNVIDGLNTQYSSSQ